MYIDQSILKYWKHTPKAQQMWLGRTKLIGIQIRWFSTWLIARKHYYFAYIYLGVHTDMNTYHHTHTCTYEYISHHNMRTLYTKGKLWTMLDETFATGPQIFKKKLHTNRPQKKILRPQICKKKKFTQKKSQTPKISAPVMCTHTTSYACRNKHNMQTILLMFARQYKQLTESQLNTHACIQHIKSTQSYKCLSQPCKHTRMYGKRNKHM